MVKFGNLALLLASFEMLFVPQTVLLPHGSVEDLHGPHHLINNWHPGDISHTTAPVIGPLLGTQAAVPSPRDAPLPKLPWLQLLCSSKFTSSRHGCGKEVSSDRVFSWHSPWLAPEIVMCLSYLSGFIVFKHNCSNLRAMWSCSFVAPAALFGARAGLKSEQGGAVTATNREASLPVEDSI